jgi:hypothetical protein
MNVTSEAAVVIDRAGVATPEAFIGARPPNSRPS